MLDADILQITASLLKYEDADVREQAAFLLGSFAISFNGRALFEDAFNPLKDLLEDEDLKVREAASMTIQKVSINDDGCIKLVQNEVPEQMIASFILHSDPKSLTFEDA